MIIADIFLSVIGIIALCIASIVDLKTKEIPNWISFSVIAAALGIRTIYSITSSNYMYLVYGIIGFIIMSFLGLILYYGRLWGGGDAKLLMGLGTLFGTAPYFTKYNHPFLMILIFYIMIVGLIYCLFARLIQQNDKEIAFAPAFLIGLIIAFIPY